MEQEVEIKNKVTEVIKGSKLIDQIGQLKIYKYNLKVCLNIVFNIYYSTR